jgi:hypothetical protein
MIPGLKLKPTHNPVSEHIAGISMQQYAHALFRSLRLILLQMQNN